VLALQCPPTPCRCGHKYQFDHHTVCPVTVHGEASAGGVARPADLENLLGYAVATERAYVGVPMLRQAMADFVNGACRGDVLPIKF